MNWSACLHFLTRFYYFFSFSSCYVVGLPPHRHSREIFANERSHAHDISATIYRAMGWARVPCRNTNQKLNFNFVVVRHSCCPLSTIGNHSALNETNPCVRWRSRERPSFHLERPPHHRFESFSSLFFYALHERKIIKSGGKKVQSRRNKIKKSRATRGVVAAVAMTPATT